MKLGKGVPSVWPGYVAAVASLVLSLLLLLAILVFAMGQVGNMVARYKPQILRETLQDEIGPPPAAPVAGAVRASGQEPASAPAPAPAAPAPQTAKAGVHKALQEIRLVFEAGVSELAGQDLEEFRQAFEQLRRTGDSAWLITASVYEGDSVNEKNTFRLMLQIRKALTDAGLEPLRVSLRLRKTADMPPGRERGEIAVVIRPFLASEAQEVKP